MLLVGLLLLSAYGCAALQALSTLHRHPNAVVGLTRLRGGAPAMAEAPAIAIIVDAEIVPNRVDEFLAVSGKWFKRGPPLL